MALASLLYWVCRRIKSDQWIWLKAAVLSDRCAWKFCAKVLHQILEFTPIIMQPSYLQ